MHHKYCKNGVVEDIPFGLDEESEGTQKLFFLSGPVMDTLRQGKTLVIVEIEARMHTLLTRKIIGLFNSEKTNPHSRPIDFCHPWYELFLSKKLFRRDQIWFIEKDEFGASRLYSLAELKVRNDRDYEKDYLLGRYGGVPILGEMRQTVIDLGQKDDHGTE